jgi:hypothetical protein
MQLHSMVMFSAKQLLAFSLAAYLTIVARY